MVRRHRVMAVGAVLLVPLAPALAAATTATTTATTVVPTIADGAPAIAPPPVIDELVDPVDRKPDGPGVWAGAAALVGGLGAVVIAVALVRRRPVGR